MYGLIGSKLSHSLSKTIHEQLVDRPYALIELSHLKEFFQQRAFSGINVTIPYKESVIPFLDDLAPLAKRIGSVNTIVNNNGRLTGYNTDYLGFRAMLSHHGISLRGKNVIILGNGGSSKMVETAAKDLGATSVRFVVRKLKSTDQLLASYLEKIDDCDVIVNTTPVGMFPDNHGPAFVCLDLFPNCETVIDLVYNPLQTNLLLSAKQRGLKTVNGLFLLVAQAFYAEELFLGQILNPNLIEPLYESLLRSQHNVVLVGMPTSGKTTIGKRIAEEWNMPFYDLDVLIEETFGAIPEIFSTQGESKFREYERLTVMEIAKRQGIVLSTGGGVIKNPENINTLKQNGILVFIDRDVDKLVREPFGSRPLLQSAEDLFRLHRERHDLYNHCCDIRIDNNDTISQAITLLKEKYDEIARH